MAVKRGFQLASGGRGVSNGGARRLATPNTGILPYPLQGRTGITRLLFIVTSPLDRPRTFASRISSAAPKFAACVSTALGLALGHH